MAKQTYTVTVEPAKSGGGRYVANIVGPAARWELGMGATPEDAIKHAWRKWWRR